MKVLGIDVESTGLKPTDRVIEIGAAVFDGDTWDVLETYTSLVWEKNYPKSSPEAQKAHKITLKELKATSQSFHYAFKAIKEMAKDCSFILAHQASFDSQMLIGQAIDYNESLENIGKIPWVCSKEDVQHKVRSKCRHLSHLALEYGLAVNPSELHRALPDVLLMGKVMKAIGIPAKYLLEYHVMGKSVILAYTKKPWTDGGLERDFVKSLGGYGWDEKEVCWKKVVKGIAELKLESSKLEGKIQYTVKRELHESK